MPDKAQADSTTEATLATVDRFNEVFNQHDVDAVMDLMTKDCVFDSTSPSPDGLRYEGQEAVRAAWEDLFRSAPEGSFESEEVFATGDRCVVRWRYTFSGGHVRGVDVIRVRDGKVAEKFAYVKG
jgi:ketosteroid isomerase-like protein